MLLERAQPKWEVLAEIQKVDWSALEKQLETGERVAVLSLSNHWTVIAQTEMPEREKLIAGIDRFAGSENE